MFLLELLCSVRFGVLFSVEGQGNKQNEGKGWKKRIDGVFPLCMSGLCSSNLERL